MAPKTGLAAQPMLFARRRARETFGVLLLAAATLHVAACAIDPTVIDVEIASATDVERVPILQLTVTRDADPLSPIVSRTVPVRSWTLTDGGIPAFAFPATTSIAVPDGWAGPATLTVEARLWNEMASTEGAVVASGTAPLTIVPRERVRTNVMLALGSLTCSNGVVDSGEGCDDGNRIAGDGCSPGCTVETTPAHGGFDAGFDAGDQLDGGS